MEGLDRIVRVVVSVHNLADEQETVPIDLVVVEHRRNLLVVGDILLLVVHHNLAAVVDSLEAHNLLVVENLLEAGLELDLGCIDPAEDRNLAAENLNECQKCKHQQGTRSNSPLGGGGPGC